MPNSECDPVETASEYEVKKIGKNKYKLCKPQDSSADIDLKITRTRLGFKATPHRVQWHTEQWHTELGSGSEYYHLRFLVSDLNMGDSDVGSSLVENCFFIINGKVLKSSPLTELSIWPMDKEEEKEKEKEKEKEEELSFKELGGDFSDSPLGQTIIQDCSIGGITYPLDCHLAIPHTHFKRLLDGCLDGRISGVHILCEGVAISTHEDWGKEGAGQDIIFLSNKGLRLDIKSIDFDYRVKSRKLADPREEGGDEDNESAETDELEMTGDEYNGPRKIEADKLITPEYKNLLWAIISLLILVLLVLIGK
jgi:hypothetical protein